MCTLLHTQCSPSQPRRSTLGSSFAAEAEEPPKEAPKPAAPASSDGWDLAFLKQNAQQAQQATQAAEKEIDGAAGGSKAKPEGGLAVGLVARGGLGSGWVDWLTGGWVTEWTGGATAPGDREAGNS